LFHAKARRRKGCPALPEGQFLDLGSDQRHQDGAPRGIDGLRAFAPLREPIFPCGARSVRSNEGRADAFVAEGSGQKGRVRDHPARLKVGDPGAKGDHKALAIGLLDFDDIARAEILDRDDRTERGSIQVGPTAWARSRLFAPYICRRGRRS
jgi:hypothetical protein